MSTEHADLAAILQDYVPRGDYEEALHTLEEVIGERDRLRTDHEGSTKRLQDLEKKFRHRSYRDAFEKARKDRKVRDDLADDVFELLKLEQDSDDPDEKAIGKALDEFLKTRKSYLQQEESPRERQRQSIPSGEGAARGKSVSPGEADFVATRSQLADALWMRQNQNRVAQAQAEGRFRIDDEA